ncbi:MAG: hypothetical protein ACTSR2_08800 [Candidatus Hodarchaeales archaeon]
MMKTKSKVMVIGVVLLCLIFINTNSAQAYVRSQFDRLSNLSSSFSKLSQMNSGQQTRTLFNRLSELGNSRQGSLSSSFVRLSYIYSGFDRLIERRGVEVSALVKLSQFVRLGNLSGNLATTSIKPSFAKIGGLSAGFADISLKPSFARLGDLPASVAATTMKPSLARMGSLSPTTPGALKPAFERFAALPTTIATGGLKPEFTRLANLDRINISSVSLKPLFIRLATISDRFSITISPSFAKLADLNRNNLGAINPELIRLGAQPTTISSINLAYNNSKQLVVPGLPILQERTSFGLFQPVKVIAMKNFSTEGKLSVIPQENTPFNSRDLAKVNAEEAAQLIFNKDINPAQLQGLPLVTPENAATLSGLEGAEASVTAQ